MRCSIIRYRMIFLLIAFSALAAARAKAQSYVGVLSYSWRVDQPVNVSHGQTLRFTWTNLNDYEPQKRVFEPVHVQVKLRTSDGSVITQTEVPPVGAGQFQFFDFSRDELNVPGEAGTGRLQVLLEATVEFRRRNHATTLSMDLDRPGSSNAVEILDTLTGRTIVVFKPKEIVVVGSRINPN